MEKVRNDLRRQGCFLLSLLLILLLPIPARAEETNTQTVRVGWYEDSYNITGENGERSGYGYEYQQSAAAYTGWDYEYVKAGWSELLEMMQNGEIDLMSGVSYTADRAKTMLFSDKPMGEEKYYLYADLIHTDISASDLSTLNGKRIGLLEGSVHATQFRQWEQEHGLQLEEVPITGFEDAVAKIENRQVDCIVSAETPQLAELGMSGILTVGGSDIYFVVNKNRPDLKEALDSAMRKIEADKPFYSDELYQRYLSATSSPVLSSAEQSWVEQHGAIRIGWMQDDTGVSVLDPDSMALTGVLTDYVRFAADSFSNQTLEFDLVGYDTMEEQVQALKNGDIDLIFHFSQNPYVAEENGFVLSNTVLSVNMAAVTAKSCFNENDANTAAIERGNYLLQWYVSYYYPKWKIVEYDSFDEVEKAVRSGQADCFVADPGQLSDYAEDKRLHNVFLTQMGNTSFAVNRGDAVLLSILNKTLRTIPSSMLTGALSMYDTARREMTLADFVKENLLAVSVGTVAIFLAILLLILSFLRKSRRAEVKAKQAAEKASELNRKLQESQHELQAALLQAESANAAKTTFLNNVSHDIRTPMNAIVGLTSLMKNDLHDPDKLQEYLAKLEASSRHLLNLINEILDMNRIESGKTILNSQPFNLGEQVTQIDNVIRPQTRARNQRFTIQLRNIRHEKLEGDATRLQQVLLNILSNAVKYTDEGGKISLDIEEIPRGGHYARFKFTVTDNGIGMSKEFQKHIYESFSRAENSVTNKVQGTGLGMAITKSIVDAMGGGISLESEPGKGSRFEVMLEFKVDEAAEHAAKQPASPARLPEKESVLAGMNFLCAEDNPLNAEILEAMLNMQGAACTICSNGREIVEKFKTAKPGDYDAILMDVMMPEMNGLDAARAIRSGENPLGETIPIIAMTANAFAEDVQKSYDAGMNSHLSKPVDMALLEQTLRKFRRDSEA